MIVFFVAVTHCRHAHAMQHNKPYQQLRKQGVISLLNGQIEGCFRSLRLLKLCYLLLSVNAMIPTIKKPLFITTTLTSWITRKHHSNKQGHS